MVPSPVSKNCFSDTVDLEKPHLLQSLTYSDLDNQIMVRIKQTAQLQAQINDQV